MRLVNILIVLFLGFYLMAGDLWARTAAQEVDLVEIQKKEKERRKKTKKSKHVFTNEDLKKIKNERANITEIHTDEKSKSTGKTSTDKNEEVREPVKEEITTKRTESTGESGGERAPTQASENINVNIPGDAETGHTRNMSIEEYWRYKSKQLEDKVKEIENLVKQEEENFKQLRNNYFIYPPDLLNERLELKKNMDESQKRVEEYKALLVIAKNNLEEFYDRARREEIPPGWLRD